jgi:hypothetical protein
VADLEKMLNEAADSHNKHAGSFEPAEQTKVMPLDPNNLEGKAARVSSSLDTK